MIINDSLLKDLSPETVADFKHWRNILYNEVDFNMPESQIHSYAHTERVLLYAISIAHERYGNNHEISEILAHAALFHDTRRQNEYLDTGHGARGAIAYKKFCESHPAFRYHSESAFLMRYHDLDDKVGVESIIKYFGQNAGKVLELYSIFKDADALDRWRLGSLGLDPKYLRTNEAKARIEFARHLVSETMSPELLSKIDRMVKSSISDRMLFVIDPQVDFISGALPIPGAENAMNSLSKYISDNDGKYKIKIITADRHPYDHCSFKDNGGEWQRHCVHDTTGASIWQCVFDKLYTTAGECIIFHKGEKKDKEEYSIFQNSKAAEQIQEIIRRENIKHIDICGLAGDICVLETLKDGINLLFEIEFHVLEKYTPSLDGGMKLKSFISENNLL